MVASGDLLCVAVSGGPDSTALLSALSQLAPSLGIALHVLHLNHSLRGAESDDDASFVRTLSDRLGWPCTISRADVLALGKQLRLGTEEAARLARHRFFAAEVGRLGAAGVALGHTADDQAETVLLRLIRGTGLRGLAGMRPVTRIDVRLEDPPRSFPLRLLRPMLFVTRDDARSHVANAGLESRHDSSNDSMAYTRNRVRSSLMTALQAENPRIVEALARLAGSAADDYDYLRARAVDSLALIAIGDDVTVKIDSRAWGALPVSIQREALRLAHERLRALSTDLTWTHVEDALECIATGALGSRVDWPDGLSVSVGVGSFVVGPTIAAVRPEPQRPVELPVPGRITLQSGRVIVARRQAAPCEWSREDRCHADVAAAAIVGQLRVRSRRNGDRFIPLGMAGSQKVQDVLVDSQVPRDERDLVPILEDDAGIVWVAGFRQSERTRVPADSHDVVCLRLRSPEHCQQVAE